MNITRSEIARDVVTAHGAAVIRAHHPSAEVRALTPAIAKAYAAFEAQNEAAVPLHAERSRLARELKELRDSKHPAREYDQTLDDELAREIARVDVALTANEKAAKKLAVDYLLAVWTNPRADETRQSAAKLALKAHEEAVAALASLEHALARRETFYNSAGRPAQWKHFEHQHSYLVSSGAFTAAHANIAKKVHTFPSGDVQAVADGGEVQTLAQVQAAAQRAANEAASATRKAAQERNRRQSIIDRNAN